MAIPNKRRADFIQARVEQAYAAAESGDGWVKLGRLWGCSNACALQWCQGKVPADICAKIAANGTASRETGNYRKYDSSKPKAHSTKFVPRVVVFDGCQYQWLEGGVLFRCGKPIEGKARCKSCAQRLATKHVGSSYRNYALIGMVSG